MTAKIHWDEPDVVCIKSASRDELVDLIASTVRMKVEGNERYFYLIVTEKEKNTLTFIEVNTSLNTLVYRYATLDSGYFATMMRSVFQHKRSWQALEAFWKKLADEKAMAETYLLKVTITRTYDRKEIEKIFLRSLDGVLGLMPA